MAIVHKAHIRPTKAEVLETVLGEPVRLLGSYRFDDPDGEVGVEGFVVQTVPGTRHVVLTYRAAPREDDEASLVCTMEHSVLGRRWIYDGTTDPVAVGCFRRALLGEQQQATVEVWDGDRQVGTTEPTARLTRVAGPASPDDGVPALVGDLDLPPGPATGPRLFVEWDGGEAVVATLG